MASISFFFIWFLEKVSMNKDPLINEKQIIVAEYKTIEDNLLEENKSYNEESHNHHNHSHDFVNVPENEKFAAFLLFLIISLHSIVEGLALGIETKISVLTPVLIAIVSHKWCDTMALGINLTRVETPLKRFLFAIITTALMTPIGKKNFFLFLIFFKIKIHFF